MSSLRTLFIAKITCQLAWDFNRFIFWLSLQTKGTSSFGKRHNKTHTLCIRCGRKAYHIQKKICAQCGYPAARTRKCKLYKTNLTSQVLFIACWSGLDPIQGHIQCACTTFESGVSPIKKQRIAVLCVFVKISFWLHLSNTM